MLLAALALSLVAGDAVPGSDGWTASLNDLMALTGFAGVVITASVLLFDYVWND